MLKKTEKTIIFGERAHRTTQYPEGWKKLFEENDAIFQSPENLIGKRSVIIFPGNGANTDRAANGECKRIIELLRASGISFEQMPHIYAVAYASEFDEEHRQEVYTDLELASYGDERKHSDNPTPAEEYYMPFFKEYILPLISDEDGKPKNFEESKKNIANMTFISHCHGSVFAYQIEKLLAEKVKEFYPKKSKELMNQVKMIHFNSRYPIGHDLGSRQFHIVSQADPKYADSFVAYDNLHEQMHRHSLSDEVALIPIQNQEEVLLMSQFTPSSRKNINDSRNDDHTIPMPVFSNAKNPNNPQKVQSEQNQKAIKVTQHLINRYVLHPEDERTPHEIISSVDKDFVKHAENVGKEFDKKRLSQSQTDKALLSLITDLNGVKIETLSVDFLSQKTKDGKFLYDVLFEKCIKNNNTIDLENLIKKIGFRIPTTQIAEGIKRAIKSENWSLLDTYVQCADNSSLDLNTNRKKLTINQFCHILKNVNPQHLEFMIKKLPFEQNTESLLFVDHMLEMATKISNSTQRIKMIDLLNKKRSEIAQNLNKKQLTSVLKTYSIAQKKSLKEVLHEKRIKSASELKKLLSDRDTQAPDLRISEMQNLRQIQRQYSNFSLDDFRQFKTKKESNPKLDVDTFVRSMKQKGK